MTVNKFIYVLFILLISTQIAYADYYTQSLSLGSDKNEYTENYIKTSQNNDSNITQSSITEYVQPVIYPVQYSPTQIIYRNNPYPYSYFNYNRGGLSIGYNSNPSMIPPGPSPHPHPINPIKPQPFTPNDGTTIYKVGPSYGRDMVFGTSVLTPQTMRGR